MLEEYLLKPGDKFFLVFPQGFVPLFVKDADPLFVYLYDPQVDAGLSPLPPSNSSQYLSTGILNLSMINDVMFGSRYITGNPNDVFKINVNDHMYQLFFGVAPSYTRVYRYYPYNVQQGALDIASWNSSYANFGYIDGFMSPLDNPSPYTETPVIPGIDIAFTIANPTPNVLTPIFKFYIRRLVVSPVKDADEVYNMFMSEKTRKLVVGGITSFQINNQMTYGVKPIDPEQVYNNTSTQAKNIIAQSLG